MAQGDNKEINQLVQATEIQDADLFVLEQGGDAKKLEGETLKGYAEDAGAESGAAAGEIAGRQAAYEMYTGKKKYNYPDSNVLDIVVTDAVNTRLKSTVIKGKTVAVNQLINPSVATVSTSSVTCTTTSDGKMTLSGTASAAISGWNEFYKNAGVSGHKAFVVGCPANTNNGVYIRVGNYSGGYITQQVGDGVIVDYSNGLSLTISILNGTNCNGIVIRPMVLDLSLIFTAAELTAIGTDVSKLKTAWLKKYGYPLPQYIPYDAGSLANVDGTYRLRGRNLWDEEWEAGGFWSDGSYNNSYPGIRSQNYIDVRPNKTYYLNVAPQYIFFYDANKIVLSYTSNQTFTTPSGCAYIKFSTVGTYGTTYKHDICITLSDSSINGKYFPYYNGGAIDCSTAPLNGFDDTVCDEKDYATGKRITRCNTINLGERDWSYNGTYKIFYSSLGSYKKIASSDTPNGVCPAYSLASLSYVLNSTTRDMVLSFGESGSFDNSIIVRNLAYSDAATFKAAMSGVMLGYEAATPTITTETPQPLATQYGYNCFEPVSGGVQSAEVAIEYAVPNATQDDIWNLLPHKVVDNDPDNAVFNVPMPYSAPAPIRKSIIKGKTVAVNQLVQSVSNTVTLTGHSSRSAQISVVNNLDSTHIYYVTVSSCAITSTNPAVGFFLQVGSTYTPYSGTEVIGNGGSNRIAFLGISTSDNSNIGDATVTYKGFNVRDLSLMFTSAELTAIGTDVSALKTAWLKKYGYPLPKAIPYDNGSLSNTDGKYLLHGRNLWDEEWELGDLNANGEKVSSSTCIRTKNLVPIDSAHLHFINTSEFKIIKCYDANGLFIGNATHSGTAVGYYISPIVGTRFVMWAFTTAYGTTYHNNICFNLSDASFNGTYEKYYNGGSIDCSGKPLNGTGASQDEEDFATGKRITRFAIHTFDGTEVWDDVANGSRWQGLSGVIKPTSTSDEVANLVCDVFPTDSWNRINNYLVSAIGVTPSGNVMVLQGEQSKLTGHSICYELATSVVTNEPPYPLDAQLGYNCLDPVSGGVQSANVSVKYVETVEGYINELVGA